MSLGLLFWQLGELHGQSSTEPSFRVIQPRKYKDKQTYRSMHKGIYKMQTPDPMFAIFLWHCNTTLWVLESNELSISLSLSFHRPGACSNKSSERNVVTNTCICIVLGFRSNTVRSGPRVFSNQFGLWRLALKEECEQFPVEGECNHHSHVLYFKYLEIRNVIKFLINSIIPILPNMKFCILYV